MRLPEEQPYIDPRQTYPIGQAAKLVSVCTKTLRKDALLNIIKSQHSPKTGRLRFRGYDLIHYRDYIR